VKPVNYWKQAAQRERKRGAIGEEERPTCSFYSRSVLAVSMPGKLSNSFFLRDWTEED
jgi:hypothetical protein